MRMRMHGWLCGGLLLGACCQPAMAWNGGGYGLTPSIRFQTGFGGGPLAARSAPRLTLQLDYEAGLVPAMAGAPAYGMSAMSRSVERDWRPLMAPLLQLDFGTRGLRAAHLGGMNVTAALRRLNETGDAAPEGITLRDWLWGGFAAAVIGGTIYAVSTGHSGADRTTTENPNCTATNQTGQQVTQTCNGTAPGG